MSERTDEREPVDYAADAKRLLKMLDARTGRGSIAVVPANSDCSPSEIRAVTPAKKKADSHEEIDAKDPQTFLGRMQSLREGK